MAKGTGHGTGPMLRRDLHAILEDTKHRKQARKVAKVKQEANKKFRHGKKQLPGGRLA